MPLYRVSGIYSVIKHVDRMVRADSEYEAKEKAWSDDYEDEFERDEESLEEFRANDVEEVGE